MPVAVVEQILAKELVNEQVLARQRRRPLALHGDADAVSVVYRAQHTRQSPWFLQPGSRRMRKDALANRTD